VAAQEVSGSSEADGERVEEDWDAITLVEVIEHLMPHDLPAMEASVFGRCSPRYVVVTTPNYEFNVVFNDPLGAHTISSKRARPHATHATSSSSSSSSSSTPSPTTTAPMSRLPFRHYDHKFEWTRAEFEEWCNAVASRYGYRYTLSGVGTRQGWTSGTAHVGRRRRRR
jgi:2-polyprenyl-3-methyl-5-hydroxy-6-metoxy-1,4-benzoquinol methylase